MVRIGFERNEPWLKKVLAIAFLSLMDRLGLTESWHAEQRGPRFGAAAETDLRQAQQALKALALGLRGGHCNSQT